MITINKTDSLVFLLQHKERNDKRNGGRLHVGWIWKDALLIWLQDEIKIQLIVLLRAMNDCDDVEKEKSQVF